LLDSLLQEVIENFSAEPWQPSGGNLSRWPQPELILSCVTDNQHLTANITACKVY